MEGKAFKAGLKALPSTPYEYAEWKKARVNIDYHVEAGRSFYSVPYQLRRELVEVRLTSLTVEVFFRHKRVTSHRRSYRPGEFVTLAEHMPKSHQKYLEWTPSRMIRWAEEHGPMTKSLVEAILESRPHPEQGFRSCLGIMRLGKHYPRERLEAACARALAIKAYSYKSVESILKKNLDRQPLPSKQDDLSLPLFHENLRGKNYYH